MYYKYTNISKAMTISLLNTLLESVNERVLFVFEKAMKFNFFSEQVFSDPDVQDCFVEIIKDRIGNRDKYYIVEKHKNNPKISDLIREGIERRNRNEVDEDSCLEYIIEKIETFVIFKHATSIVSLVQTADANMSSGIVDERDLNNVKNALHNVLNDLTFEADFGEMTADDFERRERDKTIVNTDKIIPTFMPKLNTILNGGAYPHKLYFIAAPPGFGKSLFLCNLGHEALRNGKTVYHFSLEMTSSEVMGRYDCLFSNKPMIDVVNSPVSVIRSAVEGFMNEHNGHLLIKEFPPEVLTKEMLSMYLRRKIMTTGKKPDLIIIDYADLMKSSGKETERTRDLGKIYRQLKGLSSEFDCPVWTASQINRAGFTAKESDLDNLADSWEKAQIADLVLVVRQTREEFDASQLRLYVGKNRGGEGRKEIPCKINYQYMKIEQDESNTFKDDFSEISFGSSKPKEIEY